MENLFVFAFMACAVFVSCDFPLDKPVYFPKKSCQVDYFDMWRNSVQDMDSEVMSAGYYKFNFDLEQLEQRFTLYHDDTQGGEELNFFVFNLYKLEAESDEDFDPYTYKHTRLIPLTYAERPKLYMTTEDANVEYALKSILIELPSKVYKADNYSPIHVMITLSFTSEDEEENDFVLKYPVYGAVEEDVTSNDDLKRFLQDLSNDPNSKRHRFIRYLSMLAPALKSVTQNYVQVFYDYESDVNIGLASCGYVQNDVLRNLFIHYHVLTSTDDQHNSILPVDDYLDYPAAPKIVYRAPPNVFA